MSDEQDGTSVPPQIDGACRCGQVRFRVQGAALMTMACHCTGCQRMTASAFSLSSLYPAAHFTVTMGEPVIGGLHGTTRHFFCPHCMSWLFTRPAGMDDIVNVRATLLDDAASYRPFIETFISEKLSWATTGAQHSFAAFPPPDRFPDLMAAFVDRS
ncbi:GFA family protein [Sphingomonas mollis]|uniref:GFA family protein n=1 Tax=Sphingomonas mollis TaxID=2795726 RepID=A0ABS0XNB9_9SPHN|nr:GFA family protein [Sphingomonas sp. BT553]MBJ6121522.1 GFA family protein [Sphingomonas sp. BT553]